MCFQERAGLEGDSLKPLPTRNCNLVASPTASNCIHQTALLAPQIPYVCMLQFRHNILRSTQNCKVPHHTWAETVRSHGSQDSCLWHIHAWKIRQVCSVCSLANGGGVKHACRHSKAWETTHFLAVFPLLSSDFVETYSGGQKFCWQKRLLSLSSWPLTAAGAFISEFSGADASSLGLSNSMQTVQRGRDVTSPSFPKSKTLYFQRHIQ